MRYRYYPGGEPTLFRSYCEFPNGGHAKMLIQGLVMCQAASAAPKSVRNLFPCSKRLGAMATVAAQDSEPGEGSCFGYLSRRDEVARFTCSGGRCGVADKTATTLHVGIQHRVCRALTREHASEPFPASSTVPLSFGNGAFPVEGIADECETLHQLGNP